MTKATTRQWAIYIAINTVFFACTFMGEICSMPAMLQMAHAIIQVAMISVPVSYFLLWLVPGYKPVNDFVPETLDRTFDLAIALLLIGGGDWIYLAGYLLHTAGLVYLSRRQKASGAPEAGQGEPAALAA